MKVSKVKEIIIIKIVCVFIMSPARALKLKSKREVSKQINCIFNSNVNSQCNLSINNSAESENSDKNKNVPKSGNTMN